ncbi:energy transducer TonB [Saprospira grandis]|uniref:energy transducer TonB n=1 Tax=Saprospira grandis TaxID=1008 RepID=UPI0022DE87C6|nr:energy transducer TonB [Saprospira grandis]WBM74359.1 energy transducer TonB [Saprospira grandis]
MYYRYLFLLLFFVGGVNSVLAAIAVADTLVPQTKEKTALPFPPPPPPPPPRTAAADQYSGFGINYMEPYYLSDDCPDDDFWSKNRCADLALHKVLTAALIYPKAAKEKSLEATAYIRFVVTTEGKMENIELVKLVGEEKMGFEEAALNAVKTVAKTAKWKVAKHKGKYIPMKMVVPIKFGLEEQD